MVTPKVRGAECADKQSKENIKKKKKSYREEKMAICSPVSSWSSHEWEEQNHTLSPIRTHELTLEMRMVPTATAQTNEQGKWEAKPMEKNRPKKKKKEVLLQQEQHLPEVKGGELKHSTLQLTSWRSYNGWGWTWVSIVEESDENGCKHPMLRWQVYAVPSSAHRQLWLMVRSLERKIVTPRPFPCLFSLVSSGTAAFDQNPENWSAPFFPRHQDWLYPVCRWQRWFCCMLRSRGLHCNLCLFAAVR